jgi:hypothetical protein
VIMGTPICKCLFPLTILSPFVASSINLLCFSEGNGFNSNYHHQNERVFSINIENWMNNNLMNPIIVKGESKKYFGLRKKSQAPSNEVNIIMQKKKNSSRQILKLTFETFP